MKVVQDGVIIIEKGEAKRTVNVGTEMKDAAKNLKTLDRDFQERLYKLLRERRNALSDRRPRRDQRRRGARARTKQDSGRSAQILQACLLGKQNYTMKNLGLTQGLATDVPDDADVVEILGPTQPFAPEELASLERYAKRGGKLLLALDPDAISTEDVDTSTRRTEPIPLRMASPVAPASAEAEGGGRRTRTRRSRRKTRSRRTSPMTKKPDKKPPRRRWTRQPRASAPARPRRRCAGKGAIGSLEALAAIVGVAVHADRSSRTTSNSRGVATTTRITPCSSPIGSRRTPSVSTLSRNSSRAAVVVAGAGSVQRSARARPSRSTSRCARCRARSRM